MRIFSTKSLGIRALFCLAFSLTTFHSLAQASITFEGRGRNRTMVIDGSRRIPISFEPLSGVSRIDSNFVFLYEHAFDEDYEENLTRVQLVALKTGDLVAEFYGREADLANRVGVARDGSKYFISLEDEENLEFSEEGTLNLDGMRIVHLRADGTHSSAEIEFPESVDPAEMDAQMILTPDGIVLLSTGGTDFDDDVEEETEIRAEGDSMAQILFFDLNGKFQNQGTYSFIGDLGYSISSFWSEGKLVLEFEQGARGFTPALPLRSRIFNGVKVAAGTLGGLLYYTSGFSLSADKLLESIGSIPLWSYGAAALAGYSAFMSGSQDQQALPAKQTHFQIDASKRSIVKLEQVPIEGPPPIPPTLDGLWNCQALLGSDMSLIRQNID